MDWMMEDGYWKLKEKRHNIENSGVVGQLGLQCCRRQIT